MERGYYYCLSDCKCYNWYISGYYGYRLFWTCFYSFSLCSSSFESFLSLAYWLLFLLFSLILCETNKIVSLFIDYDWLLLDLSLCFSTTMILSDIVPLFYWSLFSELSLKVWLGRLFLTILFIGEYILFVFYRLKFILL